MQKDNIMPVSCGTNFKKTYCDLGQNNVTCLAIIYIFKVLLSDLLGKQLKAGNFSHYVLAR